MVAIAQVSLCGVVAAGSPRDDLKQEHNAHAVELAQGVEHRFLALKVDSKDLVNAGEVRWLFARNRSAPASTEAKA